MISINDIAKEAGVSPATVSKVFNNYKGVSEKSIKQVTEVANRLGYFHSKHMPPLTTRNNQCLGVIFDTNQQLVICNPHYSEILQGFHAYTEENGYDTLIINRKQINNSKDYEKYCRKRGISGIVCTCYDSLIEPIYQAYTKGLPCVNVEIAYKDLPAVVSDNKDGIKQAIDFITNTGHRKIAFISAPLGSYAGRERFNAFINCMREKELIINPNYIVYAQSYSYEDGLKAAYKLYNQSSSDLPDCILCAFDEYAGAAYLMLQNKDLLVPRDISIVGFDDLEMSKYLNLTSIKQDRFLIGKTAAKVLIDMINSKNSAPEITKIPIKLVVRSSVRDNNMK